MVRSPTKQVARGNTRGKLDGKNFVVAKKAPFVPNAVMAFSACTSCVFTPPPTSLVSPGLGLGLGLRLGNGPSPNKGWVRVRVGLGLGSGLGNGWVRVRDKAKVRVKHRSQPKHRLGYG